MEKLDTLQLVALAAALGWASGIRLYAVLFIVGALGYLGWFELPAHLTVLSHPLVLAASGFMLFVEFFADKIPAFDLIWNALHTFVRVPVAGLLAYQATRQLSPGTQLLATLLGAAVALAAHGGKTAARAAVTPSPEPLSNFTLSLGEDALAIGLTWLATRHPYVAGTLATIFVVIIVLLLRWVIRALRALFRGAEQELAG